MSSRFKSILDAALSKYQKKTGKNILSHPLSVELQHCSSIDAILAILQRQADAFEQFRGGDRRLMEGIGLSVHVLYTLSRTVGEGVSLAFPPAKVIFSGIGILLAAAKDVRASHDALVDLFGRIEGFFKRLKVYTETSSATGFAEVLVNVVVEVLNILSIATKEMEQNRAKTYIKKLLGRTDIEDSLKRLDNLIREEHQAATAQVLKVTSELQDDTKKAKMTMQQIADDVDEVKWNQIQQGVHKWFSPPDPSTNYNIACKAYHKGTTGWFFEGNVFKNWESTASLLWVHGKPGAGKSILCSAIVTHIMALRDAGEAYLAYFYFDFRDETKQNVHNVLTSLLIQLSARSDPCRNIISRLYSTHGNGAQQPSDEALMNCLKEVLDVAAEHPTYIIMDALDECPDSSGMPTPREMVLDFVEDLVGQHLPNVHICVTSRPEIDIRTALKPLAMNTVSIHDENGQKEDIANYVHSVVYSDRKMQRWRDEDKKLVVEVLSERADGMFRWVFCQLETLRHSFPRNLRQVLEELPKSLDETYERLLKSISEDNREYACRLLHCITAAIRPLRVEELAEILTFDFDTSEGGIPKFHADWRWKDQEYAVLSTCSSLISIVDNNGSQVVQFSHFSVKEFLMSNRLATSTGDFCRYHILTGPAHTILARVCLGFLLHFDGHVDVKGAKSFPLAKYAAQHWVSHAQFEGVASHVEDGMKSLFDPDKPYFSAWVQMRNMGSPLFPVVPPRRVDPLYYSAYYGFQNIVEHLVIKHPKHVNGIGGTFGPPLFAALLRKHIRIAELLLEHGGNVDVRKRDRTPLHSAVETSQVDAMQLLLTYGADVNAQRGDLCTPLHLAAYNGILRVAEVLLEHTADVHSRNNKGQTPLHLASGPATSMNCDNHPGIVRLLLAHGADANARDMQDATPLRYACHFAKLKVAQVLLDYGAIINDRDTAPTLLHLLLESDHWQFHPQDRFSLAQLLLEHGADVSLRNRHNATPLHLASCKNRFELARLFLDHGADPNAKRNRGQTPLHSLLKNSRDFPNGGLSLARLLLKHGADVNAQDKNDVTPLHLASRGGKFEIVRMLLGHGANPQAMDDQGHTPLRLLPIGIYNPQDIPDLVELFIKCGADVNARDKRNITPLHGAACEGQLEIARMLLRNGANPNAVDDRGRTPLHLLSAGDGTSLRELDLLDLLLKSGVDVNAQDEKNVTILHLAAREGKFEIIRILLGHGANPKVANDQGQTPLHILSDGIYQSQELIDLVELFLKCGADANAQDRNNITPLHVASCEGQLEIARTLLGHGANPRAMNVQGQTPLHLLSEGVIVYNFQDVIDLVELLLKYGADANARDKNNITPFYLAMQREEFEIAQILFNHGAGVNVED